MPWYAGKEEMQEMPPTAGTIPPAKRRQRKKYEGEQLERARINLEKARAAQTKIITQAQRDARAENIKLGHKAQAEARKAEAVKAGRRVSTSPLEVIVRADTGRLCPEMLALPNDRWRRFALAILSQGTRNASAAYQAAGFKAKPAHLGSEASRLMHDSRMVAALHAEARNHVNTDQLIRAVAAIDDILENPRHRDQARVALSVYDRAGLNAITEHKVTVDRLGDDPQRVERIKLLLEKLGMDMEGVKRLLGNRLAPAVEATDADYEEIPE